MKQSKTPDGSVTFTLPNSASDIRQVGMRPKRRHRRGAAMAQEEPPELNRILSALIEDEPVAEAAREMLVHGFAVDVGEGGRRRRRRGVRALEPESFDIDVSLTPDEEAVVLIEQDGAYEWHFPQRVVQKKTRHRRGGPSVVESRKAHFSIPIGEGTPPRKRRGSTRVFGGAFTNFIKGKIKGFVMKFVARKAVGALSKLIEKGVEAGPVIINSAEDATNWAHVPDLSGVELPTDRPARILLLVHGTFSSTLGSYGALTEHSDGQDFLGLALLHYDAVLGYDHYTLAETPAENAEDIFGQLDSLRERSKGVEIDAIAFSRGGLVYRYLTEQVAPRAQSKLSFRNAIFVGCTNAGTELANHENWKTLVDFYTTMVAGASRLLALHPGSRIAGIVLNQGVRIIGSLVKYMAQDAVADNAVPGLASMRPEGAFVQAINKSPDRPRRPGAHSYYAIGSNFEPAPNSSAGGLGKRMALKVADGLIDRLMGEANDLVVNTASMFVVDPQPSAMLTERLPIESNDAIYHTVYFNQPSVARQCADWLGLLPRLASVGRRAPRDWWSSEVSRDFTTLPGWISVGDAARTLENDDSRFVVITRDHGNEVLHYGMPRGDLDMALNRIRSRDALIVDAIGMHETDSNSVTVDEALDSGDIYEFRDRTASIPSYLPGGRTHAVIVGDAGPIGVAAPPKLFPPKRMEERAAPPTMGRAGPALRWPSTGSRVATRGAARRTRGNYRASATTPPMASDAPPPPETIWCYAHATMPEEAVLRRRATVEVILSCDEILAATGVFDRGGGRARTDRDLIVQVQARKHCVVSGEARTEVPVPAPGAETSLFFDIVPKHAGTGEVRVIVRQGNTPIATLKLRPRFVEHGGPGVHRTTRSVTAEMVPADNRREVKNVLFIREGHMGDARTFEFEFEYEVDGNRARARGTSRPFKTPDSRTDYITHLYREIEDFWAESESEYDVFMFRLRARGAGIFKELIPLNIRKVLWEHRLELKAIQVFSDEPFIPWELAYLVEPGKPISLDSQFLAEKGMVRGYSDPDGVTLMPPTKLRFRRGAARYVIPTYPRGSGQELPGAQKEKKILERVLGATPIPPRKIDVLEAMSQPGGFDILHFACHGVANPDSVWDTGLLMQGKMRNGRYKDEKLLASEVEGYANLHDGENAGPLVFLNACQIGRAGYSLTGTGGFARAFMSNRAGAFIGTHWSVGDFSALQFSETLYKKLLDGKNMMSAVSEARKTAKNNKEVTWLAYVVYADPYARLVIEGDEV